MKTTRSTIAGLLGVLFFAGCTAEYRATATVLVRMNEAKFEQEIIDSEIDAIRETATTIIGYDESLEVRGFKNTTLIEISITSPDPQGAAKTCNAIAERYISVADPPVARAIVKTAAVPTKEI